MSRVLIACDKFKGSLSATAVRDLLCEHIPGARGFLVADGGDGTLTALQDAGFTPAALTITGPTGQPVDSQLVTRTEHGRTTVAVEMADLCGMLRLPGEQLAPLDAHSTGLGEGLVAALEHGPQEIVVGIGGSASTDGGTGLLVGLGARLLDTQGADVAPCARHLGEIATVDLSGIPTGLREVDLVLACDVDAPLLGPDGAVRVFGPQKGLDGAEADAVETAMSSWAQVLAEATGTDLRDAPGAGAAGGVGLALMAVLGARRESGVEVVLERSGFAEALDAADLVVTGEGSLDRQTLMGKTVAGVCRAAAQAQVPVVAVCGRCTLDEAQQRELGVREVHALTDLADSPEQAMSEAAALLTQVARTIAEDC